MRNFLALVLIYGFLPLNPGYALADSAEIKIGVYGPFTGGTAPNGLSMRHALELAVTEINATGGILGKKVTLVERDDESKNERGAQVIQELLDKEGVQFIIGPGNTGVADASTRYSNLKKVPQIMTATSSAKANELFKDFPENYIFRFGINDDVQSNIIIREAITARKFTHPAILCDDTNFGQAGRAKLEKNLEAMKVKPVYVGKFKIKDTDMTAQVQQAKAANADVILAYAVGPELAAISNSMERIGWPAPMIGAWTLSMPNYIKNAGKNAEGASMPMTFIESTAKDPKAKKFLESYWQKFNEKPIPSAMVAAQSYDAIYVLKAAIEQAHSIEGPKVKTAMENLEKPFVGVTGTYNKPYSATDHEAMKNDHIIVGVIKNGVVVQKSPDGK